MVRILRYLLITLSLYFSVLQTAESDRLQLTDEDSLKQSLSGRAIAFEADQFPFKRLAKWIGNKQFVLLGEGTHGTREFYHYRAELTKFLIAEHGFSTVIIEGNWPGSQQVNRFINHVDTGSAEQALSGFKLYFPWVWRNNTTAKFVGWLQQSNQNGAHQPVGFFGMDLFSLYASIERNRLLLSRDSSSISDQLLVLYDCFSGFNHNSLVYGQHVVKDPALSCQTQAEQQFQLTREHSALIQDNQQYFDLTVNALMIRAAEQYYRLLYQTDDEQVWNNREQAMLAVVNAVIENQKFQGRPTKVIIWAHNSHVGDARATAASEIGEVSLGQLLRQQEGKKNVFLMGALSYKGLVMAADEWGQPARMKTLLPAAKDSYSALFHQLSLPRFVMRLKYLPWQFMLDKRQQRFVGVAYSPEEEHLYHYKMAQINRQFDALLFVDQTSGVQSLDQ